MVVLDFSNIESKIDNNTILVSHAPPYGILDKTDVLDSNYKRKIDSIGNKNLLQLIVDKNPMYCLFGHVHEHFGVKENFINGCWHLSRKMVSIDTSRKSIQYISPKTVFNKIKEELFRIN